MTECVGDDRQVSSSRTLLVRHQSKGMTKCCCCSAKCAITISSSLTFIFGIAFLGIGVYVNQEVRGWDVEAIDLLGYLCIGLGAFLFVLAILGLAAGRSGRFLPLISYFGTLLFVLSAILVASIYGAVENGHLRYTLELHWDDIKRMLGFLHSDLNFNQALDLLHDHLLIVSGIGFGSLSVLLLGFVAALRMLGVRAVAMSLLAVLGMIGLCEGGIVGYTYGGIPKATTWLLCGCSGAQIFTSMTGICAFRCLNAECLFWACTVLIFSAAGLVYVSTATYSWLRRSELEVSERTIQPIPLSHYKHFDCGTSLVLQTPEHLLLVFGISLVSSILMICTLLFVTCLYCKRRRAFLEADRANELQAEFSDYAQREGTRGGRGRKRRPIEFAPSSRL